MAICSVGPERGSGNSLPVADFQLPIVDFIRAARSALTLGLRRPTKLRSSYRTQPGVSPDRSGQVAPPWIRFEKISAPCRGAMDYAF